MKISMRWLAEWVAVPDADQTARALTERGLEVEGIERRGDNLAGVVVAAVRARQPVAGSDHLTLVEIFDGVSVHQVVCGAPNVPAPGGRVAWARPGTTLPGGLAIGVRELRGVRSAGMLCSEQELGLGDSHDGIIVLEADAESEVGREIASELMLRDVVLEVNVTPNRGDCLSHLGIAREVGAAFALPLTRPKVDFAALLGGAGAAAPAADIRPPVAIDDVVGCPRYQARVIDGVRVGPSPLWLRRRLEAVGVRPISNLVDVTNYVMFDRGQPLHAFDHAKVAGGAIAVRRARAGETLVTLDGVTRQLETGDLLICDAERPIALAGVMGGKDSEVSDGTTRVLLESACFEPRAVRVTAKRLGLHSEASQRFERGVDVAAVDASSQRACALLVEVAGGYVAGQGSDLWPRPLEPLMVPLRRARLHAVLGLDVGAPEVRRLLGGIELGDAGGAGGSGGAEPGTGGEVLRFQIPTFRTDLTREVDLIEEVARLVGLDKLPATLPSVSRAPARSGDRVAERARELLAAAGLHEILSYSFVAPTALAALGFADDDRRARPRRVANPLRLEQSAMRTAILPGLAAALAHNQAQRVHDVRLFEVGPLFLPRAQGADDAELCDEPWVAGGLLAGDRDGWLRSGGPVDFFDARGVVEALVHGLTGHPPELAATSAVPWLHPGVAATVSVLGRELGVVGEVHPRVRDALGLGGVVFAFELGLDPLRSAPPAQLTRPGRFPGSSRDVSCFIGADIPAARVRSVLATAGGALLAEVRLLEDYREAGKVPAGQKSMLWTLTYRSPDRTLTDVEVDGAHAGVVAALAGELSATLR